MASAWFNHIWYLYRLQRGGCVFGIDELSPEEWTGLADLKDALEGERDRMMLHAVQPRTSHG